MMITTQNPCLFIFLVLIFPQTCCCINCSPSTCGNVHNISFPFRLKNDPKHCGCPMFELECQNNATAILNLNTHKFKVKAINYNNSTIRVADVSVKSNNICSFPNLSINDYSLHRFLRCPYSSHFHTTSVNFMRCPYRLKNSSLFTELTHCASSSSSMHTYIWVGSMSAQDVRYNCSVELTFLTSWDFKNWENVSVSEIHNSLLYGFKLSWSYSMTVFCNQPAGKRNALWDRVKFYGYPHSYAATLPLFLLIIAIVFVGVIIPAKIILGFAIALCFPLFINDYYWQVAIPATVVGPFFAGRFIFAFPCILWFFIYKFRRRHLSKFAEIEDFLQSENNLMPIRYSYSDIKKMTRGFREKLGQGGYGTVYKGRLRSGYDVAVKFLGKPGGNGQDFMNEIATIGRIHHVNVVKLLGYCAERSKRALVFDYMPNGSLDKHIYSRETANCLSWERKYEIAVGVARGIEYLHKGCDIQILHFDIKPHNILLDDNFTPKITDFGLAKFFSTDKKVVTMTAIRGTIGYVAPELINRGFGEVSYKADVYSFGMLLMEMIGLNKDLKRNNQESSQYFPCWIYDCFEQGHDFEFEVTGENNDDETNREIAKKMTIVALWCIQMSPGDRPPMNKVVEMLEGQVERLRVPNRASESVHVAVNCEDESWSTYSRDSISLHPHDVVSNTEITIED